MTGRCSRIAQFAAIAAGMLFIPGCATQNNVDPFECMNRSLFKVDQTIDRYVMTPFVQVYDKLLPSPVHTGVDNFFSNTFEPARIANDLLQLDIKDALSDLGRFMVNTTLGIGGLFDFASKMGMTKHRNDFGITLAKWGFRNSAYLYIPCLGPMTIRDSLSIGVDYFLFNPVSYINSDKIRLSMVGVGQVHYRWRWLPAKKVIEEAFDPYIFVRNAYLQKRAAMINEVVSGHHAAADTFVQDLEDPIVTEEDRTEAKQNRKLTEPMLEQTPEPNIKVPTQHYPNAKVPDQKPDIDEQQVLAPISPVDHEAHPTTREEPSPHDSEEHHLHS